MQVHMFAAMTEDRSSAIAYVCCLSLTEDRSTQVYMLTAFTVRGSVNASAYVNCLHCQRIGQCKCIR